MRAAARPPQANIATGGKLNVTYGYDADRLTGVTVDGYSTSQYGYGQAGEPHQATEITGPASPIGGPPAGTMTYDGNGRITSWEPATTALDGYTYSYDQQGNLTATTPTGTGKPASTYAYAHDGTRLVRRTKKDGLTTTVLYRSDGTELTHTVTDATGARTLKATRQFATPEGTPLATYRAGTWTWLLADSQGSIRLTVGPDSTTRHNYTPHGDPALPTPGSNSGDRGYLNKPHDPNGDIRLDHRNYTPSLNILTTPDPLLVPTDPQSLNPYAYARNNPIARSDPTGLINEPGAGCPPGGCLNPGGVGAAANDAADAIATPAPITASAPIDDSGWPDKVAVAAGVIGAAAETVDLVYNTGINKANTTSDLNLKGAWDELVDDSDLANPNGRDYLLGYWGSAAVPLGGSAGAATRVPRFLSLITRILTKPRSTAPRATNSGMAGVRATGAAGETTAGIVKNTTRIPSASGKAAYRIPDELNSSVLGEVKNVKSLGWSSQISDFYSYASARGLEFRLYVRPNTEFRGQLAELYKYDGFTRVDVPGMGP